MEEEIKIKEEEPKKVKRTSKVKLIFRRNRPFELVIRNKVIHRFSPYGELDVDSEIINHVDFQSVKDKFLIKEV